MSDAQQRNQAEDTQEPTERVVAQAFRVGLKDPRVVLSLLEADQVVAAKSRTHFGRCRLSMGVQVALWALRIYVVVMMVIVVVSVIHALQPR
jgi:hypothetical protein